MNKELTPLEAWERIKNTPTYDNGLVKDFHPSCCEIIETTLKNYEELTSKPVILYERSHERSQVLIDYICKNYKEVKITNLEDENKLKALNIIKDKRVDVGWLLHYIDLKKDDYTPLKWYNENLPLIDKDKELTHEEYDLLKEVLL